MKRVCMIVPSISAKGGIASVVSVYPHSELAGKYELSMLETYVEGGKIKKIIKAILAYIHFIGILLLKKPDLVHIHSAFSGSFYRKLPFVFLSGLCKIPILLHIHGSELQRFYVEASPAKKKLILRIFEAVDGIVVLAEDWIEKIKCIPFHTPIYVLHNYSIIGVLSAEREKKVKKKILFLGFITKLKGCFDMPKIFAKVLSAHPNTEFFLGGSGDEEELKKEMKEAGVLPQVHFLGWINKEEKNRQLQDSDIFFLPSYTEAMPMSILEAMGYGLAVVSSKVGGIPTIVEDEVTGFLCTPGDIDAYADALIRLLSDDALRTRMGEAGLNYAKEHYSLKKHIEMLCKIYTSLGL